MLSRRDRRGPWCCNVLRHFGRLTDQTPGAGAGRRPLARRPQLWEESRDLTTEARR